MSPLDRPQKLASIANIPSSNVDDTLLGFEQDTVNRCVREYYTSLVNIKNCYNYIVEDEEIKTSTIELSEPLEDVIDGKAAYSCYNTEILESLGFDLEQYWNGNGCTPIFEDNILKCMDTDYYSQRLIRKLLMCEAAKALQDTNGNISQLDPSCFPLRNKLLKSYSDFKQPDFSTSISASGVIFGKKDNQWYVLLGKRSKEVDVNKGYYSTIPSGSVEYKNFKENPTLISTVKREFTEELSSSKTFFKENIEAELVFNGWGMRQGHFINGYALLIKSEEAFAEIYEQDLNFEMETVVKCNVNNKEKLTDIIQFDKTSPDTIPTILNGLALFNTKNELPSLNYNIDVKEI